MSKVKIQAWRANVFLVYAKQEIPFMEKLRAQLIPLISIHYADHVWYDGLVEAHGEWDPKTIGLLQKSHFIILLVSQDLLDSELIQHGYFESYLQNGDHRIDPFKMIVPVFECEWQNTFTRDYHLVKPPESPARFSDLQKTDLYCESIVSEIKKRILTKRVEKELKYVREDIQVARLWEEPVTDDQAVLNKHIELLREQVRMQNFVIEELYHLIDKKIRAIERQLEPELKDRDKMIRVFGKNDPGVQVVEKKIDQLYMIQREYCQVKDHFDKLIRKLGKYYDGLLE